MGLFSDVDWLIIVIAGAVLLLGGDNRELLRTAGRMYAKVMHLKDELVAEMNASIAEPPKPAVPTSAPSPGVWGVGTAHHVAPLPASESEASLARLQEMSATSASVKVGGEAS